MITMILIYTLYLYNDNSDNNYNKNVNQNVKKMSRTLKKKKIEHFWDQKWVARPSRPQPQAPPRPILMTKSVQKMFF